MTQSDASNEGREERQRKPNKRCILEDGEAYICFCIEGKEALDYSGRCFSCDDKMAITLYEQNQTEYEAAIQEQIALRDQLSKERENLSVEKHLVNVYKKQAEAAHEQLEKEREMRKELVDTFNKFRDGYVSFEYFDGTIKSLIAKASELDKNLKT